MIISQNNSPLRATSMRKFLLGRKSSNDKRISGSRASSPAGSRSSSTSAPLGGGKRTRKNMRMRRVKSRRSRRGGNQCGMRQ